MYRVIMLCFWMITNAIFATSVEKFVTTVHKEHVNDGTIGFLEVFSMYLAFMVLYRTIFGAAHILRFKCRQYSEKYRTSELDLEVEFPKIKKMKTDIEDDEALLNSKLVQAEA